MNLERKFYIKAEEVESFRLLYQILQHAARKYPQRIAYTQIEARKEESQITFAQLKKNVDSLRAFLSENGYRGKHIAVIGESSVEWITVYLAVISGVGVCVPIDRELSPDVMAKQLELSDAELVFCSQKCLKKLAKALPLCQSPKKVALMRTAQPAELENAVSMDDFAAYVLQGGQLLQEKGNVALPSMIDPDTPAIIIFTSGTTGANKGVMLSNRNVMGTLRGCARLLHYPKSSISVLPINHSYELHAHLMSCMYCGTTVFINDDLKHLLKNLEHAAPHMSCMVPMMLDLIVRKLKKGIVDSGKQEQFDRAVKLSRVLRKCGIDLRKKLFAEIVRPLGGNLEMIICGGAALSQDTVDFLDDIGICVYNGYGITECSPVAAVNPNHKARKNSVGLLLPTMEVRIEHPDENGNGEIQLRGDNVMQGYYKAPQDTKKVFSVDGWFRTGDIGHVDKHNFLYLSGRLKNLIILPNGKNVYPEEVEEALQKHIPYIKECVVMADKENSGIYALCYLEPDFCRKNGLETAEQKKEYMQQAFRDYNSYAASYKRLTDFNIVDHEFEKSTTYKIQRFKITADQNMKETVSYV